MSEIVKPEVLQPGTLDGVLEGGADSAIRPNPALARLGHRREDRVDVLTHRDFPPAPGLRVLEANHAARQVDLRPQQPGDLTQTHARFERHAHNGTEVRIT